MSILLPVRDAATTLGEALASIRAQSLPDWELVAVDDGSTDASSELLDRAARADPRVRVVHTPPRGIVPALETARSLARAPLLARMDADDRALPRRLERQVGLLERDPGLAGCGSHVRYFPRAGLRGGLRRYESWLNSIRDPDRIDRELWVECPLAHPTLCLRAEVVRRTGGYREMGWPEDYDLLLRLRLGGNRLGVVPRVLLEWRDGPGRLSRTDPRYRPEAFRHVKLHFLSRSLLEGRRGLLVWGAGPLGKAFARAALARGIGLRGFVELDPRKIGQEIHGAPVIAPDGIHEFRDALGAGCVGRPGARRQIREAFESRGWHEGRDFVMVA